MHGTLVALDASYKSRLISLEFISAFQHVIHKALLFKVFKVLALVAAPFKCFLSLKLIGDSVCLLMAASVLLVQLYSVSWDPLLLLFIHLIYGLR